MEKEETLCPSFSSYACERTAETAERVRLEFSDEQNDEFEFVNLRTNPDLVYPIFDSTVRDTKVRTKLKDLFLRDRQDSSSSSSDEEEEHNHHQVEICRQSGWRKSKSTGSSMPSRRWRIKDLLKRSYSEGKQSLSFLNLNTTKKEESSKKKVSCAHEKFYLRNKAIKEEERRKSFLPYKQGLVGFFFNTHR